MEKARPGKRGPEKAREDRISIRDERTVEDYNYNARGMAGEIKSRQEGTEECKTIGKRG